MNRHIALLAAILVTAIASLASAQTTLQKAERDELFLIPRNDPEMAAAMNKARATLPEFLATMRAPKETMRGFSVKVAIRDGSQTEYFWIAPFTKKDSGFTGQIGNSPRSVRTVQRGQTINFKQNEIVDWLYVDGTRMKGNFTSCPLLKKEPPAQAKAMMERYGMECEL